MQSRKSRSGSVPRSPRFSPIATPNGGTEPTMITLSADERGNLVSTRESNQGEKNGTKVLDKHRTTAHLQRVEAEQRRRGEIRAAFTRLKDALPGASAKSSKIELLDSGEHG